MSCVGRSKNNLTDKTSDWLFAVVIVFLLLEEIRSTANTSTSTFSITFRFLIGFFIGTVLVYFGMPVIVSELVTEILFGVIFVIIKLLSPIKYK